LTKEGCSMPGKIRSIKREYPRSVAVLIGSPIELVTHRHLVNKYEVNREIKYWSTWYLLKSLSIPSYIQFWVKQKKYLLTYLQMNENTFRAHLRWLGQKGLLTIDKSNWSIRLASYEDAAQLQGIPFEGTYKISYEYEKKDKGPGTRHKPVKQSFQYLIRAEEIERRKEISLAGLMRKLDEKPKIREDLIFLLSREGCDLVRLRTDPLYFQQRLLQMQLRYFKEGSEILDFAFTYRADINRGVKRIQQHHGYKSARSVTYMKRRMFELGIILVQKICIKSEARSRLYIPDEEKGGQREGYKWILKEKVTALFITDQITPRYSTDLQTELTGIIRKTA
jgi:hypothetical protein